MRCSAARSSSLQSASAAQRRRRLLRLAWLRLRLRTLMAASSRDIFPGAILRQLVEWGYPQGVRRAVPDPTQGFSVIHITGNAKLPSADSELSWRIHDPANQNSATFFVNRDGSIRQALGDPLHMAPWSNGAIRNPDLQNPRIANVWLAKVNPNVRTLVAIENVGYEPGHPITRAQLEANAAIIRHYHRLAGLRINRRTVVGHYQIDGVERPNCPGRDKSIIDEIVAIATEEEENMGSQLQKSRDYWKAMAERRLERIENLRATVAEMEAEIAALESIEDRTAELTSIVARLRERVQGFRAAVAAAQEDLASVSP